jgi:hypothetical protein
MQLLCLASSSDAGSTRYTVRILHVFSAPLSPKRSDASERHKCLDPLHAVGSVAPLYGDSSSLPALREAMLLVTPRLHYRPIATPPQRMPTHLTPYSIVWSLTSFLGQKTNHENKTKQEAEKPLSIRPHTFPSSFNPNVLVSNTYLLPRRARRMHSAIRYTFSGVIRQQSVLPPKASPAEDDKWVLQQQLSTVITATTCAHHYRPTAHNRFEHSVAPTTQNGLSSPRVLLVWLVSLKYQFCVSSSLPFLSFFLGPLRASRWLPFYRSTARHHLARLQPRGSIKVPALVSTEDIVS